MVLEFPITSMAVSRSAALARARNLDDEDALVVGRFFSQTSTPLIVSILGLGVVVMVGAVTLGLTSARPRRQRSLTARRGQRSGTAPYRLKTPGGVRETARPMRAIVLLMVLCSTTSTTALAGLPLASELRGGAPIVSGPEETRVQILVDNDSFSLVVPENLADHDRWYTHGHSALVRQRLQLTSTSSTWAQASLGQAIYTPNELRTARPSGLHGDRPFAGWLAGSVGAEHARRDCLVDSPVCDGSAHGFGYSHVGTQLLVGTTGPWSFAGVMQRASHWLSQSLQPRGWDSVVEPAGIAVDTVVFGEGDVVAVHGTDRIGGSSPALHVRLGSTIEAGSRRTSLAGNTTVVAGLLGDPIHVEPHVDVPVAVYLQWRSSVKAVAYDTSIEARIDPDVTPSVAAPVVFDTAASIVVRVGPIEASFGQGYISNQIASLPAAQQTGQFTGQCSLSLLW